MQNDEGVPPCIGDLSFTVAESALKALGKLPKGIRKKVTKCLKLYARHPNPPFHPSLAIHKYHLPEGGWVWQMYVDYSYRLWYQRTGRAVHIVYIGPHP